MRQPAWFNLSATCCKVCPLARSSSARRAAYRLAWWPRALACMAAWPWAITAGVKLAGVPYVAPRAFLAASASFVRLEMVSCSCSCWAMTANKPTVRVLASGMSQQTKSTREPRRAKMASVKSLVQKLNGALPNRAPTRLNPALSGYEGCLFRETSL